MNQAHLVCYAGQVAEQGALAPSKGIQHLKAFCHLTRRGLQRRRIGSVTRRTVRQLDPAQDCQSRSQHARGGDKKGAHQERFSGKVR